MNQDELNALYQQYLGRAPDPSGIATWSGQDIGSVIAGITGSQEYQSNQSGGGGGGGGGDSGGGGSPAPTQSADLNALYQQYLGRAPDASGIATWSGQSPEAIIAGITGSQEYQNRSGGGAPSGANAQDLASQVFNLYATNQNYDEQLNQLNTLAATDPAAFYQARIGLLGKQMGWQTGQNTGDRNSVYQNELNSLIPGALSAGMTAEQINNLVGTNAVSASQQNQARIAQDAASGAGKGWVNQNVPGGYATLGALAAAVAAPYLAPEFFAGLGAAEAAAPLTTTELLGGAGGAFVPTAGSGASFILPELAGAAGAGGGIGSFLTPELMGPTYGELGYTGLAEGAMGPTYAELGFTGLNQGEAIAAADLAAAQAAAASAGLTGLSASSLASLASALKAGGGAVSSLLGGGGTASTGSNANLGNLLRQATGGYAQSAPGGLYKGNVNPFTFAKEQPIQNKSTTNYDPFAALNVAQTPITNTPNMWAEALRKSEG